jgi:hypothetical protein
MDATQKIKKGKLQMENEVFQKRAINQTPVPAVFLRWYELDSIMDDLLSALIDREAFLECEREAHYNWGLRFEEPLAKAEFEIVLKAAEGDENDREQNDFDEYPIMEITEGLSNKLINKILPIDLDIAQANEDGVWFIGEQYPFSPVTGVAERTSDSSAAGLLLNKLKRQLEVADKYAKDEKRKDDLLPSVWELQNGHIWDIYNEMRRIFPKEGA